METANEAPAFYRSSAERPGPVDLVTTAWHETMSRRRLIRYLVSADIRKKGTDTLLGNVWWLLDPLIAMSVYVFVMEVIFQRGVPDFALFLLAALIPFKWFTQTIGGSVGSVVRNERLIKQIQFPKIVLPIAESVSEFINFLFGMGLLLLMAVVFFGAHMSLTLLWLPVIMAVQYVLILGLSFMVAAFTVFYRDVGIVIGHLMRLLFFVSPILWSLDAAAGRGADIKLTLGETLYKLLEYNPIAILLSAYRHVIYGVVQVDADGVLTWGPPMAPDLASLGVLFAIAAVLLILGTWLFKRLEPAFAKVL